MADITYSYTLRVSKGAYRQQRISRQKTATLTTSRHSAGVQSIPTTAGGTLVAIAAGVSTLGVSVFANQGATNVQLGVRDGSGNFIPFCYLKPGEESGPIRLAMGTAALYALAITSAVDLEHFILAD
jgi:hypothetical protein